MTRKEFNNLLTEKYGKTRAEWIIKIEGGKGWDGSFYHKTQLYDIAVPGLKHQIIPYYGGLYPNKINSYGKPLILQIK